MENPIPQENTHQTEAGTNRIEAFSDGVFAIAITLLVLDLHVPQGLKTINNNTLATALQSLWPNYLTFVLSFATILIMWVYHHRLFQSIKKAETALLFSNGFLLLLVTAVPFPTALVGAYLTTPAASMACATYAGFFALINISYDILWWVAFKQKTRNATPKPHVPMNMMLSLLGFPCYLIAMVVAFWSPALTLGMCCALWIVWAITPHQAVRQ